MLIFISLLLPSITFAATPNNQFFSFKLSNTSIKEVFNYIEEHSSYVFLHAADNTLKNKINVDVQNKNIEQTLNEVLKGTNLTYEIKNQQIIIKKKDKNTPQLLLHQKNKITKVTGFVSDETGIGIIGANVWVKNTTTGVITDVDGRYNINLDTPNSVLVFSYLGMKTQEIPIGNSSEINVVLKNDTEQLDEVVVVGYGTQKKESVVGAISTLDVNKLKVPGSSISNALAGQLSGVVSMTRSGEPGKDGGASFYIRGVSSFQGSADPLVLVDGIERELDLVDVEDIESFSILKDASASAVYGMRGANGVILITTKKGAEGKPQISTRVEAGVTMPTKMVDFVNSAQWAEMYNEASGTEYYSPETIQKYKDGSDPDLFPNVNWIDEMYKKAAFNQRVNLSINGGGSIFKYYISGSYYNEGSIFKNAGDRYDYNSSINYNKFNFRANLDFDITKSTVLNINLANIYEKSFSPGSSKGDIWSYTFNTSPNAFPKEYSDETLSSPSVASGYNPWNLLVHSGYREQFWNSAQSLIGITQDLGDIIPGLKANVKFSWDAFNTQTQERTKTPTQYHASGRDEDGNLIFGEPVYEGKGELDYDASGSSTMTTYLEASLNYNRLFADKHRVGALFLYNHKIFRKTMDGDKFKSLPYKNQGIAGRVTYAFKDTYLGEFNIGYNGSENFAPKHRFGVFPAVGLGWVISQEEWFQPLTKVFTSLKFKGSYGIVGNDDIGGSRRWIYEPTIVGGSSWEYGATGNSGGSSIRIGDIANNYVSWEEAKKANIGFEAYLFNCLRIQADFFNEKRKGIFIKRDGLPAIAGVSNIPYVNLGETENKGFDGTIEFSKKINEVFLTARGNFTFNKNKLLNNDSPIPEYPYQSLIGQSFGANGYMQRLGLVALGLFESEEDIANSPEQTFGEYRVGDIKYQDINGDGKIDAYDRIPIGYTSIPEIMYGFGITAQWKNWDINVFFQGVGHTSFTIGGTSMQPFSSGNMERSAINRDIYFNSWMSTNSEEENRNAIYPRLSLQNEAGYSNNSQTSTWLLRNGRYLRLKNFELGYNMSKKVLNKSFIKSLRFYLSGNNLFTFSQFKLWDPELNSGDGSEYPLNRMVTLGFTANF